MQKTQLVSVCSLDLNDVVQLNSFHAVVLNIKIFIKDIIHSIANHYTICNAYIEADIIHSIANHYTICNAYIEADIIHSIANN